MFVPDVFADRPRYPGLRILTGGVVACVAVSALVAVQPIVALGGAGLILAALGATAVARRSSWFAVGAFGLLAGYMALDRGFAGLFMPLGPIPLYIGELALVTLLCAA